jgi:hypothetical protein
MRPNLIEEMMAAGRGVFGLLIGERQAPGYFDLGLRGLAGSFIAFLTMLAVLSYLPILLGAHSKGDPPIGLQIIEFAFIFALQIGFATLALRQIKRGDGLVPYLVALNWSSFFLSLVVVAIYAAGVGGMFVVVIAALVALVLQVNVLRLVVTLAPLQIAMVLVAQVIGFVVALMLIGLAFPLSPEEIAQLAGA